MKAILINGSPHKDGNTNDALRIVEGQLIKYGLQTEIIHIGGINIKGCQGDQNCFKNKNRQCIIQDDLTPIIDKCFDANTVAIIIGSPTYFSNVTTETKAFIDRVGYVSKANGGLLNNKVGAAVVVDRRAGANFVYSAINFFFGISEMPIASSSYWNGVKAGKPGEGNSDLEGITTLRTLGRNIFDLVKAING